MLPDQHEIADMKEEEQANSREGMIAAEARRKYEEEDQDEDEMTDQEHFDMKADLDRDQMIDDILTE